MVLYIGENWIFHAPPNPIHRGHRDSKKTFGGGPPSYPNPRSWSQWCFCFCGHQMCRLLQRLLTVFVRCPFGNSTWLRCLISPKYITKYIRDSCKMTVNVYFQLVNHIGFANGLQKKWLRDPTLLLLNSHTPAVLWFCGALGWSRTNFHLCSQIGSMHSCPRYHLLRTRPGSSWPFQPLWHSNTLRIFAS